MIELLKKIIPRAKISGNHITGGCPICGKEDKFYINTAKILEKDEDGRYVGSFDCKRGAHAGSIFTLFKHLKLLHLLTFNKTTRETMDDFDIVSLDSDDEVGQKEELLGLLEERIYIPRQYSKVESHNFLVNRGWTERQIDKYDLYQYRNYIFIGIRQFGKVVALLGRITLNKDVISIYNESHPKAKMQKFMNSRVDFARIIGGYDELTKKTKNLIIVEGIFDKEAVDEKLKLYENEETVCIFTFGKALKEEQLNAILKFNIDNVWICYDGDAIKSSLKVARELTPLFFSVKIVELGESGDPDDTPKNELIDAFKKAGRYQDVFVEIKL